MTAPVLRPYQAEAVEAARTAYRDGARSVLLVLATGLGKTVTFAEVVRRVVEREGRALVLAHRGELLDQARGKLEALGLRVGIEKAAERAGDAPVVVASVQTLRGDRLASWPADAFRLVVVDEAHHATAATYRGILAHFASARVLGVTATPDRGDGGALGEVFDAAPFRYGIREAIADGWLAPLTARRVHVEDLDLSAVRTVAGDLHRGELDAAMRAAVDGVAEPLLELAGDRQTLAFAVTVAHARDLAAAINERDPGAAVALDGSAPADERAEVVDRFRAGKVRVLVNCALFTEGFDSPEVACVAIARPTKSRSLYAQMVGRGTRLAPGKADCLVLDFAGNAGRHSLCGPADVLGADEPDDVRALAAELLTAGAKDVGDAIAEARDIAAHRAKESVQMRLAAWWAEDVDPFLGSIGEVDRSGPPATDKQRACLERQGLELPDQLGKAEASALIGRLHARRVRGFCTLRQARLLARFGVDARELSFTEARDEIDRRLRRRKESAA